MRGDSPPSISSGTARFACLPGLFGRFELAGIFKSIGGNRHANYENKEVT